MPLPGEEAFPPFAGGRFILFDLGADDDKGDFAGPDIPELPASLLFYVLVRTDVLANSFDIGLLLFELGNAALGFLSLLGELMRPDCAGDGGVREVACHDQASEEDEPRARFQEERHLRQVDKLPFGSSTFNESRWQQSLSPENAIRPRCRTNVQIDATSIVNDRIDFTGRYNK